MSLSGATVQRMVDYAKPLMRDKPNHLILHIRTNDLNLVKRLNLK